ncbi:hypothetical protein C483_02111 [Natrialba hulunbeirensis JCM 10989]|uniref:Uncharacterized protein n=1 Tax=Natrialba hulunbeirensis JCM 10989 TaxID=1227493 RepID=M0A8N5_9EURY|nr:hypothetical protein [Natrialba hulunbeirensis]ELY95120.1 hypothetical protein C483_02111 [Natrialba hulunbeirensis JCM 10989]
MTKAYFEVPDEWTEAADEMDASVAAYCRKMVRAGRRQFGYDYEPHEVPVSQKTLKTDDQVDPGADGVLEDFVLRNLSTETGQDEEDIAELLEEEIASAADRLVEQGQAKYRRSQGGWLKVIEDE